MAIARRIAYNVLFNVGAKILSTALALVNIGLITRYLGTEGFGEYSVVLAFFAFFGAIADLGLYVITAREISRPDADEEKIIGNAFALRITSSLLILLFSPLVVFFLPYPVEVKWAILIAALAFTFASSYGVLNGLFQKRLIMDRVGLAEILGKLVQVGVVILAVRLELGFLAVISALLFSMLVNFLLVVWFARKLVRLRPRFDFAYWKTFLQSSLPMGISALITFMYFKLDTIFLSFLKTNTEVGIYNAAYKVIENLTFFPAMILGLVLPILSVSIFTDKVRFRYIANETATVFFILIVPLVIGAQFLAPGIIALIGGAEFGASAQVLRILIFSLAFIFFGNFFNNILIAANLQKKLMQVLWLCAFFNIGANLLLIPRFSYLGAASVSAVTEFLVVALGFWLSWRHLGYLPRIKHAGRILLAGGLMTIFLWLTHTQPFFFTLLGGASIYLLGLWLTRTITLAEIRGIFFAKNPA